MIFNKVLIASDHAGYELKKSFIEYLKSIGTKYSDLGPESIERVDYPDFAQKLCEQLKEENPKTMGLLICGSGMGMAIQANRYKHIRAALCMIPESAKLAREHNDANILCLGSRFITSENSISIFNEFFKTNFEGGRHKDRLLKIK